MASKVLLISTVAAALGSGLVAGTFFAFSTFIMRALAALPVAQGIASMQAINRTALNPWFLSTFLGTLTLSLAIAFGCHGHPGAGLLIVASLVYIVGAFMVTVARNIPLNDALATAIPQDAEELWERYIRDWTWFNHIRAVAASIAMILFLCAALNIVRAAPSPGAEAPIPRVR